jgi:hypothetical protein
VKAVVDYANNGMESDSSGSSSSSSSDTYDELLLQLRTALAFFVESRRQELAPAREKLARRDSMSDARQALADACKYIEQNLDALGDAAVDTPIYNAVRAREEKQEWEKKHAQEAAERRRKEACHQSQKKLFTAFPHTTRQVDVK